MTEIAELKSIIGTPVDGRKEKVYKAMIRCDMWKPENWADQNESLMLKLIAARNNSNEEEEHKIEAYIGVPTGIIFTKSAFNEIG